MRHPVVKQNAPVEGPHLRALIADDRPRQPESLHPWERARERAAGAGHHGDARGEDAAEGFEVARVEP